MVNDGLAEYAARKADRFVAFGTVPLQDGTAAAAELERCVKKLGFNGVRILTNVAGRELSDPAFAPFWAMAKQLRMLVVLHPNGFTEADRLTRYYFNNVIGNPLDTSIALHYLIFDGVLERYPNLKILAVHGGGYLAAYSGRVDHAWGARSVCRGTLPKPRGLRRRQDFNGRGLSLRHGRIRSHRASRLGQLDAAAVEAIAGGNVRRLLNL
jgi:aminocarboxymuconate-semialdehyde decarboxylase